MTTTNIRISWLMFIGEKEKAKKLISEYLDW